MITKQFIIQALAVLFSTNMAYAQTNTEKYFKTDSLSFSFEHCSKTIVKKKEEINCYTDKYIIRIKDSTHIESIYWTGSPESAVTTSGDLLQVDFISSKIQTKTTNGKDALPADSYLLKLEGKYDTWPFTVSTKQLKPRTSSSLYLPFATYSDAAAAKRYLESLVGIDWLKVK